MSPNDEAPVLSAVPSTLRIPLAFRALSGNLFPEMVVDDRYAALARVGDDGRQWLRDRQSVYGTLARTRRFHEQARDFVARHPDARVCNLGCGLGDHSQWIDNGRMHMTDADLPEVMAIRREIQPSRHARHVLAELDLSAPDGWERLGLPVSRDEAPVLLMSEGVLMYLEPATVEAVPATFGERAPAGSVFGFDVMCRLSAGRAKCHGSVKQAEAEFRWGPRRLADLVAPHPRLRLQAVHQFMGGYNLFYRLLQPAFMAIAGIPFHAAHALGVTEWLASRVLPGVQGSRRHPRRGYFLHAPSQLYTVPQYRMLDGRCRIPRKKRRRCWRGCGASAASAMRSSARWKPVPIAARCCSRSRPSAAPSTG